MTYTSLLCFVGAAFVVLSAESSLRTSLEETEETKYDRRSLETKYDPPCYFNYITFTADSSQLIKTYPPGVLDCKAIRADGIGVYE